jgi:hypothetical protein
MMASMLIFLPNKGKTRCLPSRMPKNRMRIYTRGYLILEIFLVDYNLLKKHKNNEVLSDKQNERTPSRGSRLFPTHLNPSLVY